MLTLSNGNMLFQCGCIVSQSDQMIEKCVKHQYLGE